MSVLTDFVETHNKKLQIAFFDNSNGNIAPCQRSSKNIEEKDNVEVMCVKVKETSKEKATDNHAKVMTYFRTKEKDADVRFNAEILNCLGRPSYFDAQSGIQPDEFSDRTTHIGRQAQRADLWVFDWDRTISQAEGFYGASDTAKTAAGAWNVYKQSVRKEYEARCSDKRWVRNPSGFNKAFTKLNQMKMLCGGTERYENLKHVFSAKSVDNIYIITANPCVKMIYCFALLLFPNIPEDHVMTVHDYDALHKNSADQKFKMIMKLVVPIHERRNVSEMLLHFLKAPLSFSKLVNGESDDVTCRISDVKRGGKVTAECHPALSTRGADVRSEQSSWSSGGSTHTTYSNPHLF